MKNVKKLGKDHQKCQKKISKILTNQEKSVKNIEKRLKMSKNHKKTVKIIEKSSKMSKI